MMVTIAIGAILLAIAIGAYGNMREDTRVDSAKEQITSILQQARLRALSSGTEQAIVFDYVNDGVTDALGQSYSFDNINLQKFVCGTCASSDPTTTASRTFTFRRRGTADNKNIRVSSVGSDREFIVMVNNVTGRIDIRTQCVAPDCLP